MDKLKISIVFLVFVILIFNCSTIYSQDVNDTVEDNNKTVKSYADLYDKINSTQENSILELNESYKFDYNVDNESFADGVLISKNMTLSGNNNISVDGNFIARGLIINENCNVIIKNILFKNCYSTMGGAALLVSKNSNLLIDNCTFYGNTVYNSNGGAIYGLEKSTIVINNSEFYNNSAKRVSNLPWNEFKRGMGSVICMRIGTTLKLYNSKIKDNNGYLTTILIITWDDVNTDQSRFYVKNCLFENNIARTNAVIYLDEFGIAEIVDSVFRNNINTYYGGIISLDTSNSALVKNCLFEGNSGINGGAVFINSYNSKYRSNVKIDSCNFSDNVASENGGAIFAKYCNLELYNSFFYNNVANIDGGAIFSKIGNILISNSIFSENSANNGGALFLKTDKNKVTGSSFIKNIALVKGGAIYSLMKDVSSSNCKYSNNIAPAFSKIYGAYHVKITKYVSSSKRIKLKIVISSPWKMSVSQKFKIKLSKYTSKWLKTNSKGIYTFTIPKNKKATKNSLKIVMKNRVCFISKYVYKNPGKVIVPKTVKKSSKLKITIKNSKTKKAVKKAKFTVKIYTGEKFKTFKLKSNSKGIIKISINKFNKGNHKIKVYLNNDKFYINKKYSFKIN